MSTDLRAADPDVDSVTDRLIHEFEKTVTPRVVAGTVQAAQRDLTGQIVPEARHEMVYQLARYRLERITEILG
jgi:hypothetical protein